MNPRFKSILIVTICVLLLGGITLNPPASNKVLADSGHWVKSWGAVYQYSSNCFAFGGTMDDVCDIYIVHLGWNWVYDDSYGNGAESYNWVQDGRGNTVIIPLKDYTTYTTGVPSGSSIPYPYWIDYPDAPSQ